jgi:hypothetical protein
MALDIDEFNQMCSELVLKISDHMNRFIEIMEKRRNICKLNELFEQKFGNLCELNEEEINVEKSLHINSCKIFSEAKIENKSWKINYENNKLFECHLLQINNKTILNTQIVSHSNEKLYKCGFKDCDKS